MPEEPLFEVKEIWKEFLLPYGHALSVLEKISFALYPNEVLAIIGPSGCGKSTLLRIIAGLIPATKGEIFYRGKKCEGLMPGNSMIFQNFALYPWMTVRENIEIALKAKHVTAEEMEKKTKDVISLIGLHGFEDAYPREISGGMKQRVGIARALVRDPEMLFMDEAYSNLDAFTAEALRSEVIEILSKKELGLQSILIVSHDIYEVTFMADRIIFLSTNPAKIHTVLENKIPRPRDYSSADFLNMVKKLHDIYREVELAHPKPKIATIHT
jgi:NitT/TauT family transport system ATP-binding protein